MRTELRSQCIDRDVLGRDIWARATLKIEDGLGVVVTIAATGKMVFSTRSPDMSDVFVRQAPDAVHLVAHQLLTIS
jgi:hypothetical protein